MLLGKVHISRQVTNTNTCYLAMFNISTSNQHKPMLLGKVQYLDRFSAQIQSVSTSKQYKPMLLSKVRISRQVTNTNPCYLAESTYPDKSNQVKSSQSMLLGEVRISRQVTSTNPCYLAKSVYLDK
jgi:hypothetical protein